VILRKLVALAAAMGAVLAGAGALVVALCFALYALLKDAITPAGASACVALAAAALAGVAALLAVRALKGPKPDKRRPEGSGSGLDRFIDLARDRPIAAAAAAVAAGLLALRSPALAGSLAAMALGGGKDKRDRRR
jgi:hypothetical protein